MMQFFDHVYFSICDRNTAQIVKVLDAFRTPYHMTLATHHCRRHSFYGSRIFVNQEYIAHYDTGTHLVYMSEVLNVQRQSTSLSDHTFSQNQDSKFEPFRLLVDLFFVSTVSLIIDRNNSCFELLLHCNRPNIFHAPSHTLLQFLHAILEDMFGMGMI